MALTPLDFPASPTVGQLYPDPPVTGQPTYRWDGAQWLSYAAASLPTPTKPANYGKKNYIINGAMMISQENGATASPATGNYFPADQWWTETTTGGNVHTAQVVKVTPAGSPNRLRVAIGVADTSVGSNDRVQIIHRIEGLRTADLRFGSAQAKTVTLQFGVCAPAGTYCVSLANGAANRIYVVECVVSAGEANTDVIKSITIPGDTTGVWASDNTVGFDLRWFLMAGSIFQGATLNAWAGGNALATTNQFNIAGSTSNVFELFDVSLTEGTVAPPFQVPDYASELLACQRYYSLCFGDVRALASATGQNAENAIYFPVEMRAAPTVTLSGGTLLNLSGGAPSVFSPATSMVRFAISSAAAGDFFAIQSLAKCNARL